MVNQSLSLPKSKHYNIYCPLISIYNRGPALNTQTESNS